jgi:hypothetical protein
MRRWAMPAVILMVGAAMLVGCVGKGPAVKTFATLPRGDQEVPPIITTAKASATFVPNADKTQLKYKVDVKGVTNLSSALLQWAPKGANGPVVAVLYPGPVKAGPFTGTLAHSALTKMNLVGPLAGASIEALVNEIAAGKIYLNITTTAHPAGEIRGQVH